MTALNVQQFLDEQPFSRLQKRLLLLCFSIVAIDGFDTASIGFIAPALRAEWQLSALALAPLFGAGLFGLMAGALLFGSVGFFGLAYLLSSFADNLGMLLALRFLTGLGLGGAMPTTVTLTSEYCPQGRRAGLVTLMFCGFTIGSALGGLVAAQLLDTVGWRGILVIGGVAPLVLLPVLAAALPESLRWLVLRGRDGAGIAARIAGPGAAVPRLKVGDVKLPGSPVSQLFRPSLLKGTLLLWATFFMSLLIIYLLSSWLPTMLNGAGHSLSQASYISSAFQIGGTAGAILLGRWMDRNRPHRVLAFAYLAAALCIAGIGSSSTACSGSVVGSMAGGALLSAQLGSQAIFLLLAVPSVLAALALLAMSRLQGRQAAPPAAVSAAPAP